MCSGSLQVERDEVDEGPKAKHTRDGMGGRLSWRMLREAEQLPTEGDEKLCMERSEGILGAGDE